MGHKNLAQVGAENHHDKVSVTTESYYMYYEG